MNLVLKRTKATESGVFGELLDESGAHICYTLEHSYNDVPKLYSGTFQCIRGEHRLHHMTSDFETFEVTGVEGHSNILFHVGNYNKDSEGCILLGLVEESTDIVHSKAAFAAFMQLQSGVNEFTLTVE